MTVTASFALTMDEHWQPTLKLDQGFGWPQGAKVKVLEGETSLQADVEPALTQKLQMLAPTVAARLVPAGLRQEVDLAWRFLHNPMALTQDRQVWLRGTPVGLHFVGLFQTNAGLDMRPLPRGG